MRNEPCSVSNAARWATACAALLASLLGEAPQAHAQVTGDAPAGRPDAIVDLATPAGAALVRGEWRYGDTKIVEVDHHLPGPDGKPSGSPNRTWDVMPHAGARGFDVSAWPVIDPATLGARRGNGRLSFGWYRLRFSLPQKVGGLATDGAAVVLEVVADDYAEVWVDGELPRPLGQSGGALVRGYNAPNRVVVSRAARAGETHEVALFVANGPLSEPPGNYLWLRSATLDLYRPGRLGGGTRVPTQVVRLDPGLDAVVPPGAEIEKLASGFGFTEGPVWVRGGVGGAPPGGFLLFSDPNENTIYRWSPDGQVSVFRTKSGYTGADVGEYRQPGSNGLTLDREGRLTLCEHGNRRVTRVEANGTVTVLADRSEGKRLNSPNDLVYRSDGTLFFTDPPFGLPKLHDDPRRELPVTAVWSLHEGKLQSVATDLSGPNGLAFSPDEKYLYVADWDEKRKVVMRYEAHADGTLGPGSVFFDLTSAPGEEALDGVKVDVLGNVYVSGPGGLWIVSPEGKPLGTLVGPELPANFAWGDEDGRTLYLTARSGLYRIRLSVAGIRP
jgi:gluconolactonase